MTVKMLTSQMGPNVSRGAGSVQEVEDTEGARMVAAGIAVPAPVAAETATGETAKREKRA